MSAAEDRKLLTTVTTDTVPGWRTVKTFGLVRGSKGHNVRKESAAAQEAARLAAVVAIGRGANAIVGFRMAVSESLVYAYGTAVLIERDETAET